MHINKIILIELYNTLSNTHVLATHIQQQMKRLIIITNKVVNF